MRGSPMRPHRTRNRWSILVAVCVLGILIVHPQSAVAAEPDPHPVRLPTAGGLVQDVGADLVRVASTPHPATAGSGIGDGYATVGNCSFYASNSMAGGYCYNGYYGKVPPTFEKWVHRHRHSKHPDFWECKMVRPGLLHMTTKKRPGEHLMLKVCAENIDENEPWGGRNIRFRMSKAWVEDGRDVTTPGWQQVFWEVQAARHPYPFPHIAMGPQYPASVGTYTYFWAEWVNAVDKSEVEKAKPHQRSRYYAGPGYGYVFLDAQVTDVAIDPGQDLPVQHCGVALTEYDFDAPDAIPQSEGGSQESDCWTRYRHSSATDKDGIPLTATVHWKVTIQRPDGTVIAPLGTFSYEVTENVHVVEVQPEVRTDDW